MARVLNHLCFSGRDGREGCVVGRIDRFPRAIYIVGSLASGMKSTCISDISVLVEF